MDGGPESVDVRRSTGDGRAEYLAGKFSFGRIRAESEVAWVIS